MRYNRRVNKTPTTTASTLPVLRIEDLGFAYPEQPAIASGWNAAIGPGVTLLYGDTGTGKSALLHVIAGLLPATGRLTVAGARLDSAPEAYRKNVFFVDPTTERFHQVTPRECTATLNEGNPRFSEEKWQALVEGFSLAPHLDKKMFMLSTGSKRKVWMAAGLASGRPLILLDEPTAGLDAPSTRCLWHTLAGLPAQGTQAVQAVLVASAARLDTVPLAASIDLPFSH
jgi:ABC-type multidrug transport system ATPase subunit